MKDLVNGYLEKSREKHGKASDDLPPTTHCTPAEGRESGDRHLRYANPYRFACESLLVCYISMEEFFMEEENFHEESAGFPSIILKTIRN